MRRLLHILILMLLVVPLWGDPTSDLESIYPSLTGDRTITGLMGGTQSSPLTSFFNPTSSRLEVSTPAAGSILRRSFAQERVVSDGQLINFGLRSVESTEVGINPFDRTQLSFSNATESLQKLNQTSVGSRSVTAMGLRQGFGSSDTTGVFGFSRTATSTTDQKGNIRKDLVQTISLNATTSAGPAVLGLTQSESTCDGHRTTGRVTDIAIPIQLLGGKLSLTHHTDEVVVDGTPTTRDNSESVVFSFRLSGKDAMFNYLKSDRLLPGLTRSLHRMDIVLPVNLAGQAIDIQRHVNDETKNGIASESDISTVVLPLQMRGGKGRIAYLRSNTLAAGVAKRLSQFDVEFPLVISGQTYMLKRHDIDAEINGVQNNGVITKISGPMPILRGATGDYTILDQILAGVKSETRTIHLVTPIPVVGRVELTDAQRDGGSVSQSQQTIRVTTPMLGQELSFQHQTSITDANGTDSTQTVTQIVSPKVALLNGAVNVNARMMRTDTHQVTGMNFAVKPSDSITLQGILEQRDTGPTTSGSTQTLTVTYKMSDQMSLTARMVESETKSQASTLDRRVLLAANLGDVQATAGLVSWDNGGSEETAPQVSVTIGRPKGMNLAAEYREVDFNKDGKIIGLPSPILKIALGTGDPKRLSLQLRYVDKPGQPDVEQAVGLQFGFLGGTMRLAYGMNTPDPRNPRLLRLATTYDIGLERRIFGNIQMNLGVRYCDQQEPLGTDVFSRVEIWGGNANRGGEIKLTALSGDFVPMAQGGVEQAESTFDLSFTRNIRDDEKLTLTFRRILRPTGDDAQGLLMYRTAF